MLIACPECTTQYELDERLLPPTGAPVQCTSCSHVFTAAPPVGADVPLVSDISEQTEVYGREAASAPIPSATQVYGGEGSVPRSTQIFGAAGTQEPRSTRMFGAIDAPAPQEPRSTQMFGAVEAPAPQSPRSTQMFGAVEAPAPQDPRSTQMFGAVEPPAPQPRSTQMFGAIDSDAARPTPMFGTAAVSSPIGGRRRTGTAPAMLDPFDPPSMFPDEDPAQALELSIRRRRRAVLLALGAIAVGIAGFFAYSAWSKREIPLPPEAIEAHGQAVTLLRRDDPQSLAKSVEALDALLAQWPAHYEARVTQLVALLFQLDDARMEIARINAESDTINEQISKLQKRRSPSDWQNRVNALIVRLEALKKRSDPLIDRASALDAKVNQAFRTVQKEAPIANPDESLLFVRAQAIYFGVKGSDQAIVLSERYRQQGGTDGWAEIAYAEYALNARVPPDTRKQAQEGLERLRGSDASFIRPWVLTGRLLLANKQPDPAVTALESATTLNPGHTVAQDLLKHAQRERAEAAAEK